MFTGEVASKSEAYAKIINPFHTNRLLGYLKNHGGKLITGGNGDPVKCRIDPTIIVNPRKDSDLYKNEVFGPILKIQTFSNIDDVIKDING